MSLAQRIVHGTIDYIGSSLPKILGWATNQKVTKITKSGQLKLVEGSAFVSGRILQMRQPLWKRGIHVADEDEQIVLEDEDQLRDIEYVVQEHHAKKAGRHFDLRLVYKGRSVSWAIPMKGKRDGLSRFPKPGERWAAIRQPDHTVEFNEFEGHIPKGQKGHGDVKIWDAGTADIHKIEDGHVHFEIYSGPAKGIYVLVDTAKNGLIISKKPEVVDVWTKPSYSKRDADVLDELEARGRYVAERKVDGASVELRVDGRRLRTFSHRVSKRTGTLVEHTNRLPHLDGANLEGLDGTRLRAEAWHPRGVNFLSGTLNSNVDRARQVQRSAGPVRFDVFEITDLKGESVRHLPYSQRRELYVDVVDQLASPYIQPVRQVQSNFAAFYEQQVNLKGAPTDGIVVKSLEDAYPGEAQVGCDVRERNSGQRGILPTVWNEGEASITHVPMAGKAPPWIKVKPSDQVDCEVVDLSEGLGKHHGRLGALTVRTPEGSQVQVGTGFSDWERSWIWAHRDDLVGEVARVDFHVRHGKVTDTGPRFDSWHPDKSDVTLSMYSEVMDVNPYALKSAAGWRVAS